MSLAGVVLHNTCIQRGDVAPRVVRICQNSNLGASKRDWVVL